MPTARTVLEEDDKHGCIAWLDKKPKHSVVYISFGSLWTPTRDLIRGIADGIRSSKQSFLWALRPSSSTRDVHELLPPGFLEETDGLIVPWAPQIHVLAHSSIGAFLTHCGWNSTLESMSTGVPMIPVPMMADQTTNCKLVVDIWKVGIRVKFALRSDGPVVDSDDICRAVKLLCHNPEGREVRARVEKLMVGIRRAGGSTSAHLRDFVRSWNE
jgi:UDP:flavonoid glycosyltransferase YjiC (YdhE family)